MSQDSSNGETTPPKHKGRNAPWQPGQSGNPNGRPKGSRNKLGEAFVAALYDDFQVNGVEAIQKVRDDRPDVYLKVIAQVVPKELLVKDFNLQDMSDEDFIELATAVRSYVASTAGNKNKPGIAPKARKDRAGEPLN